MRCCTVKKKKSFFFNKRFFSFLIKKNLLIHFLLFCCYSWPTNKIGDPQLFSIFLAICTCDLYNNGDLSQESMYYDYRSRIAARSQQDR